jgi:hypothetical protein
MGVEHEIGQTAEHLVEDWPTRCRKIALMTTYGAVFLFVVNDEAANEFLSALCMLCASYAVTTWCSLDAIRHKKLFVRGFIWPFMTTWPVGILIYLLWTRRARGILTYLKALVGIVVTVALAFSVTSWL